MTVETIIALPSKLKELWRLTGVQLLADTPTSHVFRANRDGESVIVKALKPRGADEINGIGYLRWRNGMGAARVYDCVGNICLMQDAGETTLLDLHTAKGDEAANAALVAMLPALFQPTSQPIPEGLPDMNAHLADLFVISARSDLGVLEAPLKLAAQVADELIRRPVQSQPLHGDIHHANLITHDAETWLAIDAKGLIGDPHYDVANLFGNPRGESKIVLNGRRASHLADILSTALNLDRQCILKFALAHSGASIAWSLKNTRTLDKFAKERLDLIPILLSLIDS